MKLITLLALFGAVSTTTITIDDQKIAEIAKTW